MRGISPQMIVEKSNIKKVPAKSLGSFLIDERDSSRERKIKGRVVCFVRRAQPIRIPEKKGREFLSMK
ncbi:MAG: hypothetical protein DRI36_01580 [Caldiserica bacterium]|nr:MAG: hypothetical protein DRI36_01580 [Caldisericota bacterium]